MLTLDILSFVFPFAMLLAAGGDVWRMTIPNALVLLLAAAFVPTVLLSGADGSTMLAHVACGLIALVLCFALFAAGWMGGGDAKLIAATALWLGPSPIFLQYLHLSALLGGAVTICVILMRRRLQPVTGLISLDRILDKNAGIPYGLALGVAGLVVYASPNFPF